MAVRLGHGFGRLEHDERGLGQRTRAIGLDVGLEVFPLDELPDQVERAVGLCSDVENARGVLAFELGEGACLATEALDFLVVARAGKQQLDDDALVELDVEALDEEDADASKESRGPGTCPQ